MPSTYAHSRFGKDVLDQLGDADKRLIESERDLFEIGLQGPDILFYYEPLHANAVSDRGGEIHSEAGKVFFDRAAREIGEVTGVRKRAMLAYALGAICHFSLDVTCHAYINQYEAERGVLHAEIEGELERYLLVLDGYDPVKKNLVERFYPEKRSAIAIAPFYEGIGQVGIYKSLRSFVWYHELVHCETALKRKGIYAGLKAMGKYRSLHGHIVDPERLEECEESDWRILQLYEQAIPVAVRLIGAFVEGIEKESPETCTKDPVYSYNFNGEEV